MMPTSPGGWNKDMYFNRKQPLSFAIFFGRPVQKDRFLTQPARTEQVDRLFAHRRKTGPLGRPEPAGVRTGDNRIAAPSARALSVSPAADLTKLRPTERGIAGVNRPAEARPGRMRDPSHRHQAFFDTVFAQKIGGLFGILKFVRIFAHAFDTKAVTNDGAIAQLVEQRTENPCVPGSIPGGTTPNYSDLQQCKSLFYFTKAHNLHTRFFVSFAKKRRASGRKGTPSLHIREDAGREETKIPARSGCIIGRNHYLCPGAASRSAVSAVRASGFGRCPVCRIMPKLTHQTLRI